MSAKKEHTSLQRRIGKGATEVHQIGNRLRRDLRRVVIEVDLKIDTRPLLGDGRNFLPLIERKRARLGRPQAIDEALAPWILLRWCSAQVAGRDARRRR